MGKAEGKRQLERPNFNGKIMTLKERRRQNMEGQVADARLVSMMKFSALSTYLFTLFSRILTITYLLPFIALIIAAVTEYPRTCKAFYAINCRARWDKKE